MKKAMVFGAGISGNGAKNLLERMGYEVYLVDDKVAMSSKEGETHLDDIEIFIKSPGVPYTELVKKAQKKGIKIIDEIELSYEYMIQYNIDTKIIGITGTNGKTTTTTKIWELFKYAGFDVEFAGNIGKSFAQLLVDEKERNLDYIILELSSFQLENLIDFKPYISMIINLTPDHLARYEGVEEYYDTKFNICKNQDKNSYFILNTDDCEILKREDKIGAFKIRVSKKEVEDCYVKEGHLYYKDREVLEVSKLSLKGEHNLQNVLFIVTTAMLCGIDVVKIRDFLYTTKTLKHRMEEFFDYGKLKFINDSKGTNIDSTTYAVESFRGCTLIVGGYDKKLDWTPLVDLIIKSTSEVYLIGEIADILETRLKERGYKEIYNLKNIEDTLKDIKKRYTKADDRVILFSPATSSYDQFANYEERGDKFKELVSEIFGR